MTYKLKRILEQCNGYAEDACSYIADRISSHLAHQYSEANLMLPEEDESVIIEDRLRGELRRVRAYD